MRAAVACFISFGLFDLWLFADVGHISATTRIVLGLTILAIVEWQVTRHVAVHLINLTCAVGLFAAAAAWALVARSTIHQDTFALFLVFGTVFVVSSSLFFRFRFAVSAGCSSAITALLCAVVAATGVSFDTKLVLNAYFLVFLWFALYLSWQLTFERYATFLNETRARINEKAARDKGRQLARIANTDHLTGLRNRRAVVCEYAQYRERWNKDRRPIGVLLIDVDHFKAFNDRYGHQAGDNCLVGVAHALKLAADAHDAIVGRYGGEEFIAFCHVDDAQALLGFAEAMREAVEALEVQHAERSDGMGIVTVSIGASMTRVGTSPELERVSSEADRALYLAKADGRNRSHHFDPDAPESWHPDHGIAELLARALADDLVSLVYQPIVATDTGRLCAVETLMRLRDDDGAPISPAAFIPVAERTGLIGELGRWALRRACTDILVGGVAERVSVNVSAVQLRAPGFPMYVARLLGELRLHPSSLALEITEGIDISLDAHILDVIRSLKALGVQIWLDDFGTGYAGLQWLQMITFDVVKVDRCFLHRIDTDDGQLFLQDVLQLLRNRDLRVVVEGVETDDHLAFVRSAGVGMAQGYLMGRPQPVCQFSKAPHHPPEDARRAPS
ncbi:putative bifunctional diguanylate cyclase/phosphodiesterase [Aureimonas flava]|uniref:putative bifunctional diguanylate cyclase/phosphodiesterase n=1 Tax=Aureimonas flava TaxID=2320271 RepID=UPI001459FBC0|nr:GGDEF domain-containing phosphodiesterase [Aureimonas flava]